MKRRNLVRLLIRTAVFAVTVFLCIWKPELVDITTWPSNPILWCYLVLFFLDYAGHFFPLRTTPIGSRKQFASSYLPAEKQPDDDLLRQEIRLQDRGAILALVQFILETSVLYILYFVRILNRSDMLACVVLYSIADSICVLWFCPFRSWAMHNRCCAVCRIYNWDMLMNVAPILVIPCAFTFVLAAAGVVCLLQWEIRYRLHPERFFDFSNLALRCSHCRNDCCPRQHKNKDGYSSMPLSKS